MKRIFLYGPPASGKTTLGKLLAAHLKAQFLDLDDEIVAASGYAIPEIFAAKGEAHFRQLETDMLAKILGENSTFPNHSATQVIALGGGTLLKAQNRELCEAQGTVICLEPPSAAERARRLKADARSRPLGDQTDARAAHYASFPLRLADFFTAGPSLVLVGNGIASSLIADLPVVIDETVAKLHRASLDISPSSLLSSLPSGEEHKTPETVLSLWHDFAKAGLGRRDSVAAIGGGVTGDLTGFAAATWMRGIDWLNVPTTLLAMVDASTGGKTGCDLPEGKNLAGAFHPPKLVVIDTDFLKTLPGEILAAGRAEMIKHELIGGRRGGRCGAIPTASEIAENLKVKVKIVEEDPFETKGRRILLNCGHTVAHAIEKVTRYSVSHGEAVAIGCVAEAQLAAVLKLANPGWPQELAVAFAAAGLETDLPPGVSWRQLVPIMQGDKKREGREVVFALPCAWGDVRAVRLDMAKFPMK